MMMPPCEICNEDYFDYNTPETQNGHQCDPVKIKEYIEELKESSRKDKEELRRIRDDIKVVLSKHAAEILDKDSFQIESSFFKELWDSAKTKHYHADTSVDFLHSCMAYQKILCDAFRLFQTDKAAKTSGCSCTVCGCESLFQKLTRLHSSCMTACKLFGYDKGYHPTKFDMTPKEIINQSQNSNVDF